MPIAELKNNIVPFASTRPRACKGWPVGSATRQNFPPPERVIQCTLRLVERKEISLLVTEPVGLPMWLGGYSVHKFSFNHDIRSMAAGRRNFSPASNAVALVAPCQMTLHTTSAWASAPMAS